MASVAKVRVSGATAYVLPKDGQTLTEDSVKAALTGKGLKFGSMAAKHMAKPVALVTANLKGVG